MTAAVPDPDTGNGLVPETADRYQCSACGNRTRFDVVETVRRSRFHHFTLGGEVSIDEETVLERRVERIVCRWCDRSDAVVALQD